MDSTDSAASLPLQRALVIVVRGLSPFFLGAYGNEWVHTPTCDRLASRGVVFDQHYAPDVGVSSPSPGFAGEGFGERVQASSLSEPLSPNPSPRKAGERGSTVTDRERHSLIHLRKAAYELFEQIPSSNPAIVLFESKALLPPWDPPARYLHYYFGRNRANDEDDDDLPLTPWEGPLPEHIAPDDDVTLERLQNTFAAVVSTFDRGLGKLLAGSRQRGFGQEALIVVTSDLAFPVGEQGPVGFGDHGVIESVAHLPLIIRLPIREHAGMRVEGLTQPGDLPATLQAFFSGQRNAGLWPLIRGEVETIRDHLLIHSNGETGVRTNDRLCIVPKSGEPRLYLKPQDRFEAHDVGSKREDELDAMVKMIRD